MNTTRRISIAALLALAGACLSSPFTSPAAARTIPGPVPPQVQQVGVITSLRALGAHPPIVYLREYHSGTATGGGLFRWSGSSTASEDGCTVIVPDGAPATGRWMREYDGPLQATWCGAKGTGDESDATANVTAIQAALNVAGHSHAGKIGAVYIPPGRYYLNGRLTLPLHVRLYGTGNGTAHSNLGLALGYQSELIHTAGVNDHMIVVDDTTDSSFAHGIAIKGLALRGGWTGPGDAVTTSGSAIYFDGVTPGQGVEIEDLQIHNFAEDGVRLTRHALPGVFRNIWGRKLGGDVLHVTTVDTRGTHMFTADLLQGDFIMGAIAHVDEGAITAGGAQQSFLFSNIKHEIDSTATEDDVYGQDTIWLEDVKLSAVTVVNVNTQPVNMGGGTPEAHSILKITGSGAKAPYWTVTGSRLGILGSSPSPGYLVDDVVRGIQVPAARRSASLAPQISYLIGSGGDVVVQDVRRLSDTTGVMDSGPRATLTNDGEWNFYNGSGTFYANLRGLSEGKVGTDYGFQALKLLARGGTELPAPSITGWGTGATVSMVDPQSGAVANTDQRWRFVVTAGTTPSANPTATITFQDGIFTSSQKWPVGPVATCSMGTASTGAIAFITTGARGISTLVVTYQGTPVDTFTYVIDCVLMG